MTVVGGGPVGVEVAGEIATDYPNKKVTLVHSGDALLAPNLLPKFQKKVFDDLTKLKVEVLLGQRVIAPTPSNGQDSTEKKTDDVEEIKSDNSSETPSDIPELKRQTVTTTKGTSIETDLIFWFTGATVNNNVLQKNFSDLLDESGHVKVNSLLQVEGHENIFAIGDVNNVKEAKMGYFAGAQADLTADNIKKLVKKDKKLKSYIPKGPGMLVSIGRNGGASTFIIIPLHKLIQFVQLNSLALQLYLVVLSPKTSKASICSFHDIGQYLTRKYHSNLP